MLAIFLDGESKSGKTAVGRAIQATLEQNGYSTSVIVAGNFFRRLTVLALKSKPTVAEADWLEPAVQKVLSGHEIYETDYDASELDLPEVNALVSEVGKMDFVQAAAGLWRVKAADLALVSNAAVLMFDGRNLRTKLANWLTKNKVPIVLELVIACSAEAAASRYLADGGNKNPTSAELADATEMVNQRRLADRNRRQAPYIDPENPVELIAGQPAVALAQAFAINTTSPPRAIRFDNSEVPRDVGLATVSELALLAVRRLV